jgi:hypothetical protein
VFVDVVEGVWSKFDEGSKVRWCEKVVENGGMEKIGLMEMEA